MKLPPWTALVPVFCLLAGCASSPPSGKRNAIFFTKAENTYFMGGTYVGMERLGNLSPDEPGNKWFHENTLLIQGHRASLDKIPVVIKHGRKLHSASDGGFYLYKGRCDWIGGHLVLHDMKLVMVDCGPVAVGADGKPLELRWDITLNHDGSLFMNGVRYTRKLVRDRSVKSEVGISR